MVDPNSVIMTNLVDQNVWGYIGGPYIFYPPLGLGVDCVKSFLYTIIKLHATFQYVCIYLPSDVRL